MKNVKAMKNMFKLFNVNVDNSDLLSIESHLDNGKNLTIKQIKLCDLYTELSDNFDLVFKVMKREPPKETKDLFKEYVLDGVSVAVLANKYDKETNNIYRDLKKVADDIERMRNLSLAFVKHIIDPIANIE